MAPNKTVIHLGGTEQDCYPPGYVTLLPDGRRGLDEELQEKNLSKQFDVEALQFVLGGLHQIKGAGVPDAPMEQMVLNARWQQLDRVASLEEMENMLRYFSEACRITTTSLCKLHGKIRKGEE